MLPVLLSVGNTNISSYGVFLVLGILFGVFLVWRLCRAWDFNEEKALDLTLFAFIGGLVGARIYFVIEHLSVFTNSPLSIVLINKTPGLSFWGGILGGWLTLSLLARRARLDFWQLADIAAVGFLGGLIFSDIGCFLGGCNIGTPFTGFFAVSMAGAVGKRWPVQLIEAAFLTIGLIKLWSYATHFHQRGKIVSVGFIFVGAVKLILEPIKQDRSQGIFPLVLIILGLTIYYRITRQNPISQFKNLVRLSTNLMTRHEERKMMVQNIGRNWYNQKTAFSWKVRNLKKFLKRSNVKLP